MQQEIAETNLNAEHAEVAEHFSRKTFGATSASSAFEIRLCVLVALGGFSGGFSTNASPCDLGVETRCRQPPLTSYDDSPVSNNLPVYVDVLFDGQQKRGRKGSRQ